MDKKVNPVSKVLFNVNKITAYQCPVTPVSQRGYDKPRGVTEILISIFYIAINDANSGIVIFPVIAKLSKPLEICIMGDTYKE